MNWLWKLGRENWIFLLILLLALFLRIYRLDELTTFGGDQGQDFLVVKDMVLYHKWTLLGIQASTGTFYQGPVYLYLLYPFFVLFGLKPIAGAYLAVCMSMASILLLYKICNKYFSNKLAIFSTLLFAVSTELIVYGNTPLYQNFLPFFILLSIWIFLDKREKLTYSLYLGLVLGVGIELHLLNISLALAYLLYYALFAKNKIVKVIGIGLGMIAGISPTILFELRHQFLNTTQLLHSNKVTLDSSVFSKYFLPWLKGAAIFLAGNSMAVGLGVLVVIGILFIVLKSSFTNYIKLKRLTIFTTVITMLLSFRLPVSAPQYMLPVWIVLIIILPFLIVQIFPKISAYLLLGLLITVNLIYSVNRLGNNHGYNMSVGLTLRKIEAAGKIVSQDSVSHPNFNVGSLLAGGGGPRNYPLRYTLEIYGAKPESVDNFPNNNFMYLLANSKQVEIFESKAWEIESMKPFVIGAWWDLGEDIYLYRLDKILKQAK